ncbi:acylphosphatase-1-like [Sycon ciliatum]|uniref:acylphosphatase-1-like n=1 Tax=Sycon ciliatum TaxID=27933 RepID=UPI0020AC3E6B
MRTQTTSVPWALLQSVVALACGFFCLSVILHSFELLFSNLATGGVSRPAAATAAAGAGAVAGGVSGGARPAQGKLLSVEFEVHGKVQGVFFRKHTKQNAEKHGLTGWVRNTIYNTVVGTIEGPQQNIHTMKQWLRTKGSPRSRVDRCSFKSERTIHTRRYKTFEIQKTT